MDNLILVFKFSKWSKGTYDGIGEKYKVQLVVSRMLQARLPASRSVKPRLLN